MAVLSEIPTLGLTRTYDTGSCHLVNCSQDDQVVILDIVPVILAPKYCVHIFYVKLLLILQNCDYDYSGL